VSSGLADKAFVVDGALAAGAALAAALVERRARVLVVAADEATTEAVAGPLGDDAFSLAADPTTADGVDALSASVPIVLGRLDGAVLNCAGAGTTAGVAELDDLAWRRACIRLLEAPARAVRELAPQLADGGVIVLVAPPPDGGATDVLLPALQALAEALDASLGPDVHVRLEAAADRDALLSALDFDVRPGA